MDWVQVLADMENLNNYVEKMELPRSYKSKIVETVVYETDRIRKEAYYEIGKQEYEEHTGKVDVFGKYKIKTIFDMAEEEYNIKNKSK